MQLTLNVAAARKRLGNVNDRISAKQQTAFWAQCVRDIDGRWSEHASIQGFMGARYFYGPQSRINYDDEKEKRLLLANLAVRQELYDAYEKGFMSQDVNDFRLWLEQLHHILEYRPTEDWVDDIHTTTAHTRVIYQDVLPIVRKYDDPYALPGAAGPMFEGFPIEALPIDEIEGDLIRHTYPSLQYADIYFAAAQEELIGLLHKPHTVQPYIHGVARMYQLLINLHFFPSINTSLYMNIANSLLEIGGLQGMEHGINDFVAMRLQPYNYQAYFYDEVARRHPAILL